MGRGVFLGQPRHCICTIVSRGLSATYAKEVMFSSAFVNVLVSRITWKLPNRFLQNSVERQHMGYGNYSIFVVIRIKLYVKLRLRLDGGKSNPSRVAVTFCGIMFTRLWVWFWIWVDWIKGYWALSEVCALLSAILVFPLFACLNFKKKLLTKFLDGMGCVTSNKRFDSSVDPRCGTRNFKGNLAIAG